MTQYSSSYRKRRNLMIRARLYAWTLIFLSCQLLILISFIEAWWVTHLLTLEAHLASWWFMIFSALVILVIFSIVLIRLTLHLSYHLENQRIGQGIVFSFFLAMYALLFWYLNEPVKVSYLSVSKLFVVFLSFRFWQTQLRFKQHELRLASIPQIYLVSWREFFVSKWVIVSSWLMLALGFSLAVVAEDVILNMSAWQGLLLLTIFYLVFSSFVRNPMAHS